MKMKNEERRTKNEKRKIPVCPELGTPVLFRGTSVRPYTAWHVLQKDLVFAKLREPTLLPNFGFYSNTWSEEQKRKKQTKAIFHL
jgi:hypothetical protein